MAHDVRLGPVLDLGEHVWFNLTSTNDVQAAWYIKANLWVGGQIVDQFDTTSKRVNNFFSTNNFAEYMYGRKLLAILERLYHVTSGPELRAAELASERFVPFVMGMSADDAQHAAFEQLRLRGRLPPSSRSGAIGAESLLLLEKLPDEYTFKQTRLDEWYKGEVKNEPAWSLAELIKIIPQWLEKPPSAHLAVFEPSFDFVVQANAAAAARQGRGPLPPGYILKGNCFLCGEKNCYVDNKCEKFCLTCKNKHCPGLVPSKKCVIHADTMPVGATTTRFDGKPVSDKTLAFLCDEWRKHKAGRPRAHAADGGPAEEGLSQEELGDFELDEYARAYAGSAERFAPPQNFEWYNLDASSAEAHLRSSAPRRGGGGRRHRVRLCRRRHARGAGVGRVLRAHRVKARRGRARRGRHRLPFRRVKAQRGRLRLPSRARGASAGAVSAARRVRVRRDRHCARAGGGVRAGRGARRRRVAGGARLQRAARARARAPRQRAVRRARRRAARRDRRRHDPPFRAHPSCRQGAHCLGLVGAASSPPGADDAAQEPPD